MSETKAKQEKQTIKPSLDSESLRKKIEAKLLSRGIGNPEEASDEQLYRAVVSVVKDVMNSANQVMEGVKESTGIDLPSIIAGYAGGIAAKGTGAKKDGKSEKKD